MKSRVIEFTADFVIDKKDFVTLPLCKESWARWVVVDSLEFAARPGPRAVPRTLARRVLPALPPALAGDEAAAEDDVGM